MDERRQEASRPTAMRRRPVALYVDRSSRQWVVQDPEGNFWALPSTPDPWDDRRPFSPAGESELEPVPGHYKYMLGLPS
ncbi:MAG: hypothetical protein K2X82_07650 [Gemmataceae bacterium]|nr:hypothetical protein [Gemmataceae bacterium]